MRVDDAPQPLRCSMGAEGVNPARGHRMLPLQGHLAANVAAVEGRQSGWTAPSIAR